MREDKRERERRRKRPGVARECGKGAAAGELIILKTRFVI